MNSTTHSRINKVIPNVQQLLTCDPDSFVDEFNDIGIVNLACAQGLPYADGCNFSKYVDILDVIAETVRRETERSWRIFNLKPAQFLHSEIVFRLYTMEHVFRSVFHIVYDPIVQSNIHPGGQAWMTSDSSLIFIHGILSPKRKGTCSSLPTFAIAVGRRLGYPLKLVLVPNHTLYRWDDGTESYNLQHTQAGGDIQPDEYFHGWPHKWTDNEFRLNERTNVWLTSMTAKQEVSKFLCNRAIMLSNLGRTRETAESLDAAERFNPSNPAVSALWHNLMCRQVDRLHTVESHLTKANNLSFQTTECVTPREYHDLHVPQLTISGTDLHRIRDQLLSMVDSLLLENHDQLDRQ